MPEIANSSKLILKQNKQNDVELFNAVSDRLQAISYQNRHCISPNTEVYKDLKIYGMDFCEILIWINDCYEANFYIDDISEYVPPDSTVEWVKELLSKIFKFERDYSKYKSFTVNEMILIIKGESHLCVPKQDNARS